MTEEQILAALSTVQEPDLGKDLVTLNMVKDIKINGNSVSFTVVLTTPACPLKDLIRKNCINAVKQLADTQAIVLVNFTANTTSNRTDQQSTLPDVRNIIAVVSGKGGVGKSTIAANLAIALSQGGAKVGLMDADIYGPSVPIMFGVRGERPMMKQVGEKAKIVPLDRFGIKLMSIGLLVDEKNAVVWRGPMASSAIRQFDQLKDSVVQLYGVVMTADSLMGIPSVSVVVKGQNRGTFTNDNGVFSIVVLKGDFVEFSSIGYKPKLVEVPRNIQGNQYSIIQLLVTDTVYLPVTIIRPRPTREQFERDFVNTKIPDDAYEIARQNNDATKRRVLMRTLPRDGTEAANYSLKQGATRYYSAGQMPPQNIFNPFAWGEFIQAWKRGDFKNK